MAPRGIIHESPAADGRNSEMISPSLTFPENAEVELLRERSREGFAVSLSLSITTSPPPCSLNFRYQNGQISPRVRFTWRKCGQRPGFFAFCCSLT